MQHRVRVKWKPLLSTESRNHLICPPLIVVHGTTHICPYTALDLLFAISTKLVAPLLSRVNFIFRLAASTHTAQRCSESCVCQTTQSLPRHAHIVQHNTAYSALPQTYQAVRLSWQDVPPPVSTTVVHELRSCVRQHARYAIGLRPASYDGGV